MIDDSASHSPPTEEELSQWNTTRKNASSRVKSGRSAPMPNLDEAALNKRRERQRLKNPQEDIAELGLEESIDTLHQPEAPSGLANKETSYSFTIPASSKSFSWYKPKKYNSLLEARRSGVWTYPQSEREAARCAVFYDLWKNGYFMGNGLRFGGDWLVYPGRFTIYNPSI
jgi:tRNA-splicing endonuclease subunit Sen34